MRIRAIAASSLLACAGLLSTVSADEMPTANSTATAAPAPTLPPAPAATKPASDQERMVCRAERTIGSNRVQRVCRSVAQIEREREAARSQLGKAQICSDCGGE
jgi:hypothetical protein